MAEKPDNYSKYVLLIVGIVVVIALIALFTSSRPAITRYGYPKKISDTKISDTPTATQNPCSAGGSRYTGSCSYWNQLPLSDAEVEEVPTCDLVPFIIKVTATRVYNGAVCEDGCQSTQKQKCESGGWGTYTQDYLAELKCEEECEHLGEWVVPGTSYGDCVKKEFTVLNPKLFNCANKHDYKVLDPDDPTGTKLIRCTQKEDTCTYEYKCTCKRDIITLTVEKINVTAEKKESSISGGS